MESQQKARENQYWKATLQILMPYTAKRKNGEGNHNIQIEGLKVLKLSRF